MPSSRIFLTSQIRIPLAAVGAGKGSDLLAFFADRLKVMLRDQGKRPDLVDAVFALGDDDLVRIVSRVEALDAFDVLAGLVDKSLVVSLAGENRYRMLETLREYALVQLQANPLLTGAPRKFDSSEFTPVNPCTGTRIRPSFSAPTHPGARVISANPCCVYKITPIGSGGV